ncbi:DUF1028 domain-containing protein [Pedobacter hiemivivus]|uniref:DUF1028 domain-containing protein n=1 Tax=Pedobacter hiemivivus TaxID=2530454 RepID=A0A4U1GNM0_9SPHI|nr:DUF1028 domain-containing protein [Pedobacter hiemivivus]TKC65684.1 DUF1028 domain-containing protein [Pedobacter hiemivivus]
MRKLKQLILIFGLLVLFTNSAKATWSIIIIDPKTREIGIAGASCTYSVYGIGGIVPGKGAVVVQAMSNKSARNKGLQMVLADAAPDEILKAMRSPDFDPENQQYAIVCLSKIDSPMTYTGLETTPDKGTVTTEGVSIQGNTLSNKSMLNKILQAVVKAQKASLPIQDVLMLALEAGAEYGGDKRCGDRKALSAFITVAKPDDDARHPYINIIVNQSDDTTNAVKALRKRFDRMKNR